MSRVPSASRARPAHRTVLLLALLAGCSVLDKTYTAPTPGASGEPPVEVAVEFVDNKGLSASELRVPIEDYLFDLSRDPSSESTVYDAALELEDLYRTQGYPVAKVGYEYQPVSDDQERPKRVRVRFLVEEGPLVTVSMALTGNREFEETELLRLWSRKRTSTFSFGGYVFVEAQVRAFVEELRAFYRMHGRLDATVEGPRIDVDLERGIARVAIAIDEGRVHTIGEVEIDAALREALGDDMPKPPTGRARTRTELSTYRTALRNALRRRGHPEPRIEVRIVPEDRAMLVARLTVEGEPGPTVTVDSVEVHGNERTLDGVILGRIDLEPGQVYDGEEVDASLQRLYRTGLFRKVEIVENRLPDDPTHMALDVQVEEGDARSVELLAGYGSYEQLRGGIRLGDRNVFGTGRGISTDSKVSMKGYSNGITLSDPDFFRTGSTLTVTGEHFRREEPSFTDEALGGTVALARPVLDALVARVGYTYRERANAEAFTVLPQDQLVDYTEAKVFFELRHDRRDNLVFPRSGHTELLSFERLSPALGASVELDKLAFRAAVYLPLMDPVNLVLRSEQSLLWPHEGSAQVPLQERWFAGGEASVRSFKEAQLGPKDADGQPVGGEYRNVLGVELRFPLWRTFEGALFVDAGNVGREVQDYGFDDMHYGIGAGLRLLLPVGPVRVDGAWNPDQDPGDDEWVVHVSVGYPF